MEAERRQNPDRSEEGAITQREDEEGDWREEGGSLFPET